MELARATLLGSDLGIVEGNLWGNACLGGDGEVRKGRGGFGSELLCLAGPVGLDKETGSDNIFWTNFTNVIVLLVF
jgi:hypothetical protein